MAIACNSAPGRPQQDHYQGLRLWRTDLENFQDWQDLEVLARAKSDLQTFLTAFQPDCLHISGSHNGLLFLLQFVKHQLPTLTTLHGPLVGGASPLAESSFKTLARSRLIACCSQWTLNHARETLPELSDRLRLVVNALPFHCQVPTWSRPEAPRMLFAGRLAREKGLDLAVKSLSLLPEEFRLAVAGEGPLLATIQEQVEQLSLAERVDFLGRLSPSKLLVALSQSLLLLMPSEAEGFGLVALEASRVGCPVVASKVGGLAEVIIDQETGLLVQSPDPAGLARAAQEIWERPEWSRRLSENARHHAAETFCWDTFIEKYLELYREVLALS